MENKLLKIKNDNINLYYFLLDNDVNEENYVLLVTKYNAKMYFDKIQNIHTKLKKHLETTISGEKLSDAQLEEYADKKKAVENNDVSYFEEEANLLGITPEDLFNAVKQKAALWSIEKANGMKKIGALRVKLKALVKEEKFDLVEFILKDIKSMKQYDFNTDLVSYFKDVEDRYNQSVLDTEEQ